MTKRMVESEWGDRMVADDEAPELTYPEVYNQRVWWRTREGHMVRIEDMSDLHLANTVAYLENTATTVLAAARWERLRQELVDTDPYAYNPSAPVLIRTIHGVPVVDQMRCEMKARAKRRVQPEVDHERVAVLRAHLASLRGEIASLQASIDRAHERKNEELARADGSGEYPRQSVLRSTELHVSWCRTEVARMCDAEVRAERRLAAAERGE